MNLAAIRELCRDARGGCRSLADLIAVCGAERDIDAAMQVGDRLAVRSAVADLFAAARWPVPPVGYLVWLAS